MKQTRVVGDLVYRERIYDPRPGRSLMLAVVLGDDREKYVIPALDRAHITEVDAGLFIDGIEVNPRGRGSKNIKSDDYPQRWFCRPVPRPLVANPATSRLEARRHAEAIGAMVRRRSTRRNGFGTPQGE